MKVKLSIGDHIGWQTIVLDVPDGSDAECLACPSEVDRFDFWDTVAGQVLPRGRALIWQVAP